MSRALRPGGIQDMAAPTETGEVGSERAGWFAYLAFIVVWVINLKVVVARAEREGRNMTLWQLYAICLPVVSLVHLLILERKRATGDE
jgi:hypothetical protein